MIKPGLLESEELLEICYQTKANTYVIITDDHVLPLYGKKLQSRLSGSHLLSIPSGEQYKTRATKEQLEDKMFALGCGRDTCIIALGGGVITDLVGFLAATYCRGVPVIYIPTTLLGMVDASIGGKTGVDTPYGKNLIGTFTQPSAVLIDSNTLDTLPEKEIKNGLVEMIKHALIADANMFDQLYEKQDFKKMIVENSNIKRRIVLQDERDQGIRQLLNFGHTIGHALEVASQYSISHGEAVALGIVAESYLSMRLGFLPESDFLKIRTIFEHYDISCKINCSINSIKSYLSMDKKAVKKIPRFVLLDKIGKPHLSEYGYSRPVDKQLLEEVVSQIR